MITSEERAALREKLENRWLTAADEAALLDALDAAGADLREAREALDWMIAHASPQHSAACASQGDDDPCICGVAEGYAAAIAKARP